MSRDPFTIENGFKTVLQRDGSCQIGLWQALANPYTAEISAAAGFDWLLFDGEHGPNDVPLLLAQLQAVAPYAVHPVARPPSGEARLIKQYLDIGFQTLLVPFIETAQQAEAVVVATRYPPAGIRGVGSGLARAARWNGVPGYLQRANEQICVLLQIETQLGLTNIEAIAEVEGVDGIFIGPADLAAALGHIGRPDHPNVVQRIEGAITKLQATRKPIGILATTADLIARYRSLGCRFIAVGTDVALFSRALSELARLHGKGSGADAAPAPRTGY
jgi:4-hydroxy-2-oxoheptanedioate aldolase